MFRLEPFNELIIGAMYCIQILTDSSSDSIDDEGTLSDGNHAPFTTATWNANVLNECLRAVYDLKQQQKQLESQFLDSSLE